MKTGVPSDDERYGFLPHTQVRAGDELVTITRQDAEAMRQALLAASRNHPDREYLLPLLEHRTAFISSDGVVHVGVFVLTTRDSGLFLEYLPRPRGAGRSDTFGWSAHVERDGGRWKVVELHHTHIRWLVE